MMPRDTKNDNDTVDVFIDAPAGGNMGTYYNLPDGSLVFFDASTAPFGLCQLSSGKWTVVRLGLVAYSRPLDSKEAARAWVRQVRGDEDERTSEAN
jgi:hypothetical protein